MELDAERRTNIDTIMTTPTVRQAKVLRLMELMQVLCATPKTADQIAEILSIHKRNAYRYLNLIDQLGITVQIRKKQSTKPHGQFKFMYYIDQCPCCGRNKSDS